MNETEDFFFNLCKGAAVILYVLAICALFGII